MTVSLVTHPRKRRKATSSYFTKSVPPPTVSPDHSNKSLFSRHFRTRTSAAYESVQSFTPTFPVTLCQECHRCTSTRQLCGHACFFKAHAPLREWHDLRKMILESGDQTTYSANQLLKGWQCYIASSESTKVCFSSPQGLEFTNKASILCALGIVEGSSKASDNVLVHRSSDSIHTGSDRKIDIEGSRNKSHSHDLPSHGQLSRLSMDQQVPPDSPTTNSPFGFLEELFVNDPWRLLLSTIFLNRTSRKQVDLVLYDFLQHWPTATDAAKAQDWPLMSCIIAPLGIRHRRAVGIVRFSQTYLQLMQTLPNPSTEWTRKEILSLPNCGEYAWDAYRIFIRRDLTGIPQDKALQDYVDYQSARQKRDLLEAYRTQSSDVM